VSAVHRRRQAFLFFAVVAIAGVVVVLLARGGGESGPRRLAPGQGSTNTTADPLAYNADARTTFEQRAAAGLAHVLYVKSPGGVLATARRVARLRPLVDAAARHAGEDADTLEAIVFLESGGRTDARASDDLHAAAGLTQILAQTATDLLGLRVDVTASQRLTARIARATSPGRIAALRAKRRRVDERFDARKALAATTRYLAFARGRLHRDDLAVESYHMGVGNLQRALAAYGDGTVPYAQLFFDSTPLRHARAWRILAALGDDSSTYLWRVRAAQDIMKLYRDDRPALDRRIVAQSWPSAERVLRPPSQTPRFATDAALRTPRLVLLDGAVLRGARGRLVARLAAPLAHAPAGERALRPDAAALLRYLSAGVADVARTAPLVVTSAARSIATERDEGRGGATVETAPSQHTTGYAFDVSRAYRNGAQAQAFQFWLDRLQALDVIAWARLPDAIHITVGPRARELVAAVLGTR